ncbi:MAG: hypothetical protein PHR25_01410 [Clostridia bacterium]|nr:hypothetical protein [Clostridia bacterium]MDD4375424.1 hypothetical protein [Clostridia bacterium]
MRFKVNLNILVKNIIILIVVIAVILLCIFLPGSGSFKPNVTKSRYRSNKSAIKLKNVYEEEGRKEEFLMEVSKIQETISKLLLESNVVNEATLKTKIKELNKELKKDDWNKIGIPIPAFWVGIWEINSKGTVKFKFIKKDAEPSWIKDEDVIMHIEEN